MSLTRTPAELALEVLRSMAVIDATESLTAEDQTYLTGIYYDCYEEMFDERLAYWLKDEIPRAIFSAIRDLIANEVRGAYGEPQSPEAKASNELVIKMRIRRHVERKKDGRPVQAEYF